MLRSSRNPMRKIYNLKLVTFDLWWLKYMWFCSEGFELVTPFLVLITLCDLRIAREYLFVTDTNAFVSNAQGQIMIWNFRVRASPELIFHKINCICRTLDATEYATPTSQQHRLPGASLYLLPNFHKLMLRSSGNSRLLLRAIIKSFLWGWVNLSHWFCTHKYSVASLMHAARGHSS